MVEQLAPDAPTKRSAPPFCHGLWQLVRVGSMAIDTIAATCRSPEPRPR